nr:TPR domain-containing protein [Colletotrichum truncatum]KAF6793615.1 TPR domain-containing protein [Colletotrichum truncatum]
MLLYDHSSAQEVFSTIRDDDLLIPEFIEDGELLSNEASKDSGANQLRLQSLEIILQCAIRTRDWERAHRLMHRIETTTPGYFTTSKGKTSMWPWQRSLYAGLIHEKTDKRGLASEFFCQSLKLFLCLYMHVMFPHDNRRIWSLPEPSRLIAAVARLFMTEPSPYTELDLRTPEAGSILLSSPPDKMCYDHPDDSETSEYALWAMELGRTRTVWDTLRNHGSIDADFATALIKEEKWLELCSKDDLSPEERAEFQKLTEEEDDFTGLLHRSRGGEISQRKMEDLRNPVHDVSKFWKAIPRNALVVYTCISEDGFSIMFISDLGPLLSRVSVETSSAAFQATVIMALSAIREQKGELDILIPVLDKLSKWLLPHDFGHWIALFPHLIFCVTGELAQLPMGLLRFRGDYLGLKKKISHVPSLATLHHLRTRDTKPIMSSTEISIIARPGSLADCRVTGIEPLHMAGVEALMVQSLTQGTLHNAKDVTSGSFVEQFEKARILHMCTHGLIDPDHPLNSHLLLQDRLRVLDLLSARSDVDLVIFSACLSGSGIASESGDVVGFSHAILAAGARSYIGAMWKVNDIATLMQMTLFYLNVTKGCLVSEAWRLAAVELRDSTPESIRQFLISMIDRWDAWEAEGQASESVAPPAPASPPPNVTHRPDAHVSDWPTSAERGIRRPAVGPLTNGTTTVSVPV